MTARSGAATALGPVADGDRAARNSLPQAVHGFIFTWIGHEERAAALERKLSALIPITVINSESGARERHPTWVHLDESAYFAAQWSRALTQFDAQVLFHIQADADSDQFASIIARARSLFAQYPIGVYEPDVDYTDIRYDRAVLRSLEPDLFLVPWTDCTCWFIRGALVRQFPAFDLATNIYGWGVCRVIAALAVVNGQMCVRDYSFTVRHPKGRGYPSDAAMHQLEAYVASLPPDLRSEVARLVTARDAARARVEG